MHLTVVVFLVHLYMYTKREMAAVRLKGNKFVYLSDCQRRSQHIRQNIFRLLH